MSKKLSVPNILASFTETWSPKLVANLDSAYDIKIAKLDGEFIWHAHPDADELFYVLNGNLTIQIGDAEDHIKEEIVMAAGDLYVVPSRTRHRPVARNAEVMIMEKSTVVNTGDEPQSERTKVAEDRRTAI